MNKSDVEDKLLLSSVVRERAEEILKESPETAHFPFSAADSLKLFHELEVHRIELEMVIDELTIQSASAESLKIKEMRNESSLASQSILDAIQSEIAIIEETGIIVAVNRKWMELADVASTEPVCTSIGANYLSVCDDAVGDDALIAKAVAAGIRSVIENSEAVFSLEYPCHTITEKRWFKASASRFNHNSFSRIIIIHENCTDQKKRELEIEYKNKKLQELNSQKDQLFSIIAHDLRGPFSGFLGLTDLLSEKVAEWNIDTTQHIAVLMKKSAKNVYHLLGDLLEWSRMQNGLLVFKPINNLLLPKIGESIALYEIAAKKKKITIKLQISNDLMVFADEYMLAGIIRNLVYNAIKYTPSGGIITISAKSVSENQVEIAVEDTGVGMSTNIIDQLFNLAVNTNRKGTDGELTSGLGLMLCKDFIEKHGGKLSIESKEGKGSTFSFSVPSGSKESCIN
jgi:signal transduction histidine kinase